MARVAIFSSGNGSNFQAIAERIQSEASHQVVLMVCNCKNAYSFTRSKKLHIESYFIDYKGRSREETEEELVALLRSKKIDLIVLAGYMKLLTPTLIDAFPQRIINIHPALLPKYPGTHGIEESYESGDKECGITIHYVDYGMDTGAIIKQASFFRKEGISLEAFEQEIHRLEHENYSEVVLSLLNKIETAKKERL